MLPQTEIDKYGGKGAILNHIRDNTNFYQNRNAQSISGRVRLYSNGKKGVAVLEEISMKS